MNLVVFFFFFRIIFVRTLSFSFLLLTAYCPEETSVYYHSRINISRSTETLH